MRTFARLVTLAIFIASNAANADETWIEVAYASMKETVHADITSGRVYAEFSDCADYTMDYGLDFDLADLEEPGVEPRYNLLYLSYEIAKIEDSLKQYPADLWQPVLREYERSALDEIASDVQMGLQELAGSSLADVQRIIARTLTKFNRSSGSMNAVFAFSYECGAGGNEVEIRAEGASRVEYLNQIFVDACDEMDATSIPQHFCRWVDLGPGSNSAMLSGTYQVRATFGSTIVTRTLHVPDLVDDVFEIAP